MWARRGIGKGHVSAARELFLAMAAALAKHEAEFNLGFRCAQVDDMGHTVLTRTSDDVVDQAARLRSGIGH